MIRELIISVIVLGCLGNVKLEVSEDSEELVYRDCKQSSDFDLHSFDLLYFPPDSSGWSMTRVYGRFPTETLVSKIEVSYAVLYPLGLHGKWKHSYITINNTYVPQQEVELSPWFSLQNATKNSYEGLFTIHGEASKIYCYKFNFDL